ncbi:hypothetical protein J19TS2_24000 [Cohnella xylanilytica]|uniref:Uncharacterized protein n=1 Tax=Cohnella xylanilytica TaxID=557555 RepID=A0A841TZI5_9BACL|nr:hypothetical protein [Cohnella xylanilytica]MBB6691280.1 hypothetical protein [Cohnella xylanilytica]GIO12845.1 hypothetical protein J19TS2_24000 [Cohnella xylanilytica]
MMRRLLPLLAAVLLALQLGGCGAGAGNDSNAAPSPSSNTEAPLAASPSGSPTAARPEPSASESPSASAPAESVRPEDPEAALLNAAKEVVGALRDRDLKRLASWIDPELGVRFSPYAHMDEKNDLVFKPEKLPTFKDAEALTWGSYDGSGEPIELTFRDYFEKFVYDQDFAEAPDVTANKLLGTGNTPFNGKELYPGSSFVEFHFPGFDDKLEGHDWESLVLVFVPSGDQWRLCAVVHSQWTI